MVENHVMGQQERIRGGRDLRLDDRPEITVLPFDGVQVGACQADRIQTYFASDMMNNPGIQASGLLMPYLCSSHRLK